MRISPHLSLAWLFSAFTFALAFVAWLLIVSKIEGAAPSLSGLLRAGFVAFFGGALLQLVYGGLVYLGLSRLGMFQWWTVTLAYVAPVVVLSFVFNDTPRDFLGTIPWLVFAVIVALVSWFLASKHAALGQVS